jgi:hypothetical protein
VLPFTCYRHLAHEGDAQLILVAQSTKMPSGTPIRQNRINTSEVDDFEPIAIRQLHEAGVQVRRDRLGRVVEIDARLFIDGELVMETEGRLAERQRSKLDAAMFAFGNCANLQIAALGCPVVDLQYLKRMPGSAELRWLNLSFSAIDSNALAPIRERFPGTVALYLSGTSVGDEDLEIIAAMAHIQMLSLCRTKVGNIGVAKLSKSATLRELNAQDLPLTNEMCELVSPMESLEALCIDRASIDDDCVARLVTVFPNLRVLSVDGTGISDLGLQQLLMLKSLERLVVGDCDISEDAAEEFRRIRPTCELLRTRMVKKLGR